MAPSTLTETTTYEQVLAQFHALSDEERQQFLHHLGQAQPLSHPVGNNGSAPMQRGQERHPLPLPEHITDNPLYVTGDSLMQSLTTATAEDDTRTFVDLIRDVDWSHRTPEELRYTIDLSFMMMMSRISLDLIKSGADIFPNDAELQRLKRGFFPENPSRYVRREPIKKLQESQDWLAQNAYKYRGKWIAVNQGVLIGEATTYEEIDEIITQADDPESTLLQKVL